MHEWLVYIGGLADVEVPLDEPFGGYVITEAGKAARFPKDVAESLLQHGENSDPDGPHARQWRKATTKEIAAAEKAASDPTDETAEPAAATAGEGDLS